MPLSSISRSLLVPLVLSENSGTDSGEPGLAKFFQKVKSDSGIKNNDKILVGNDPAVPVVLSVSHRTSDGSIVKNLSVAEMGENEILNLYSNSTTNTLSVKIKSEMNTPGTSTDNLIHNSDGLEEAGETLPIAAKADSAIFKNLECSQPTESNESPPTDRESIGEPSLGPPDYCSDLPSYTELAQKKLIDRFEHCLFFKSPEEVEQRIESNIQLDAHLPKYSPTKYRLAVVMVKFERSQLNDLVTDSELFAFSINQNKWRPAIVELNSTQLNLYELNLSDFELDEISFLSESSLIRDMRQEKQFYYLDESFQKSFYDSSFPSFQGVDVFESINFDDGIVPLGTGSQYCANYNRHHGYQEKLRLKQKLEKKKSNLIFKNFSFNHSSSSTDIPGRQDISNLHNYNILKAVVRNPTLYLNDSKLIKSFSLQHGKLGLANDCYFNTKDQTLVSSVFGRYHSPVSDGGASTNNVLRLRLEAFQFVLNFKYLNELILWYNSLVIGMDVALDLLIRELPKFNNIPTRRRRGRRPKKKRREGSQMRSRALSSAGLFLTRSRRNTGTSSTSGATGGHERQSSAFSLESLEQQQQQQQIQQQINNVKAKNTPLFNYFLSEFEPKKKNTKEKRKEKKKEKTAARAIPEAVPAAEIVPSSQPEVRSVSSSSPKLNSPVFKTVARIGNSRERSNSLNNLNRARSNTLLSPKMQYLPLASQGFKRSNSNVSFTDDHSNGELQVSFEKIFGLMDKQAGLSFSNLTDVLDSTFEIEPSEPVTDVGAKLQKELSLQEEDDTYTEQEASVADPLFEQSQFEFNLSILDSEDQSGLESESGREFEFSDDVYDETSERDSDFERVVDEDFDLEDNEYNNDRPLIASVNSTYKWNPIDKNPTSRRIIKDSLKSMTILKSTDSWINSKIIKESVVPNFHFIKSNFFTKKFRSANSAEANDKAFLERKQKLSKTVKYYKYFVVAPGGLVLMSSLK